MQSLRPLQKEHVRPRLGISTCLLGEPVRYNGGHQLDHFLTDTLGRHVEWVPVCPEVECGLDTPREAMRLVGDPKNPRLVTSTTGVDMTQQMQEWARRRVCELEQQDLNGFVFKKDSPSSGMTRVKVYDHNGVPQRVGVGVFARAFMDHFPLLPVEDDGRLHDPGLRENFAERVFCLRRYRESVAPDGRMEDLVRFHADHKMQIMAHSEKHLRRLGRMVADGAQREFDELVADYGRLLMEALSSRATPSRHANVLMHMLGFFKEQLSGDEKREMLQVINAYKRELVPLVVPVTLLRHYVRKYQQPYLAGQSYINPHPSELKLRNHA